MGGNVETSQRVVDVLLGALGLAAASQGTMNNLLFGDATFGYYETICGGAGATPNADGADAVHTHMTNTRLTDPEVLERRYPVRVRSFVDSPRLGRRRAACAAATASSAASSSCKPLEVSILSQRRGPYAPYGLAGGQPGALGRNTLQRADGTSTSCPRQAQFQRPAGRRADDRNARRRRFRRSAIVDERRSRTLRWAGPCFSGLRARGHV